MVTLADIHVAYGTHTVLDRISMTIADDARVALCGANGSGKSTLMRIIAGQIKADSGSVTVARNTTVAYLPQAGIEHAGRTLAEELQLAFADQLAGEQQLRTVEDELAECDDEAEIERLLARYQELTDRVGVGGAADRAARTDRVSRGLGFVAEDLGKDTATFSSGWQMRIALAKILLQAPSLLLLDEPSNYLDLEARQWLEEFLRGRAGGYLLVAHDRTFMDRTCDRVSEIYRGAVRTYTSSFSSYLETRANEFAQMAAAFERQQEEIAKMEAFIRKFRANASKARMVQSRIKQLERIELLEPPPVQQQIDFSFPAAPRGGRRALSAAGLSVSYGDHDVLRGIDLELDRGDRLGLVGDNGVGKSTLLRALAGRQDFDRGRVQLGTGVTIGYYAQDETAGLTGDHSVLEEVEAAAPTEVIPRLRSLLGAFLFSGDAVFKPLHVLSGGERSRVALVKLLLQPANVLLLDEPTSHLDLSAISVLTTALQQFAGTLVFVSHDEYFISALATKVLQVTTAGVRMYPGDWGYFRWKQEQAAADAAATAAAANGQPPDNGRRDGDSSSAGGSGARVGAGVRRSSARTSRREAELLERLDALQGEQRALEAQLGDPAVYVDGAAVRRLKQRLAEIGREQEQVSAAWEGMEAAGAGATDRAEHKSRARDGKRRR